MQKKNYQGACQSVSRPLVSVSPRSNRPTPTFSTTAYYYLYVLLPLRRAITLYLADNEQTEAQPPRPTSLRSSKAQNDHHLHTIPPPVPSTTTTTNHHYMFTVVWYFTDFPRFFIISFYLSSLDNNRVHQVLHGRRSNEFCLVTSRSILQLLKFRLLF